MDTAVSAVPKERTVALVNTYVVHTAAMLNAFSASCERSLSQVQASLQAADTRLALLEAQLAQLPEGELSPNAVDPAGSGEGLDATDSGQALDALASGDGHGHRASGGTVSDVHACTNQAPRAADILQADSPQTAKSGQPDPAFSGQPDHNALDAAEAAGEAMTRDAEADGSGERSGGLTGPAAASDDADDYASGEDIEGDVGLRDRSSSELSQPSQAPGHDADTAAARTKSGATIRSDLGID